MKKQHFPILIIIIIIMMTLLAGAFTGVSLIRDMSGLPRVVVAQAAG